MGFAKSQVEESQNDHRLSRDQLIAENLPYVKRIVNRIAIHLPSSVEIDDLVNAGIVGLIEAADRYDPNRDNKFITYAAFRIKGAVLSELGSRDFLSKANRRKTREMEKTYLMLEKKLERRPTDEEVAKELGLNLNDYFQVKKLSSISFVSLEELGYALKEDEAEDLMQRLVSNDEEDPLTLTKAKEVEGVIAETIEQLPEKEKLVISLYYWDELTMKEIGKALGITESRVSQIHSQAVIHLKAKLRKESFSEG